MKVLFIALLTMLAPSLAGAAEADAVGGKKPRFVAFSLEYTNFSVSWDGIRWENQRLAEDSVAHDINVLRAGAFGNGAFVFAGGATNKKEQKDIEGVAGGNMSYFRQTTDGVKWAGDVYNGVFTVVFGGGEFVAVRPGAQWRSKDGVKWTKSKANPSNKLIPIHSATFAGEGFFVTVPGNGGTSRLITKDFVTIQSSDAAFKQFPAAAAGKGVFVIVGDDGCRDATSDGVKWTLHRGEPGDALQSAVWTGKQFYAAGRTAKGDGVVYTSADGQQWKRQAGLSIPSFKVAYHSGLYVAVAKNNAWYSEDGLTWKASPQPPKGINMYPVARTD